MLKKGMFIAEVKLPSQGLQIYIFNGI